MSWLKFAGIATACLLPALAFGAQVPGLDGEGLAWAFAEASRRPLSLAPLFLLATAAALGARSGKWRRGAAMEAGGLPGAFLAGFVASEAAFPSLGGGGAQGVELALAAALMALAGWACFSHLSELGKSWGGVGAGTRAWAGACAILPPLAAVLAWHGSSHEVRALGTMGLAFLCSCALFNAWWLPCSRALTGLFEGGRSGSRSGSSAALSASPWLAAATASAWFGAPLGATLLLALPCALGLAAVALASRSGVADWE